MDLKIEDSQEVWVAWTNSDCTEGRGYEYPLAVCVSKETAIRLGRKGGVQGSNCRVSKHLAVNIGRQWLVPGRIIQESAEDRESRETQERHEAALAKAKAAGLTDEDLEALTWKENRWLSL